MADPLPLPDKPSLAWLRKQAKRRLDEMRAAHAAGDPPRLADAQFAIAKDYGFASWRALKAHLDALTVDGQLFEAAKTGDVATLTARLDAHPEKLHVRSTPYAWTLLHTAASEGHLAAVDLLLSRGLHVNTREKGDNTYAMHWAAAAGHLDVVRRLADAGGDVIGHGDDHEFEVIGWATCWDPPQPHVAIAEFLISRGARHHIFSAIAMSLADEVRRLVAADPGALSRRLSRNENHMMPLHFAVRRHRPEMVALLLDLGADPLGVDGSGFPAAAYASNAEMDRPVMERIHALTTAELISAERGARPARGGLMDLIAALALQDWETAERLVRDESAHGGPRALASGGASAGALHLAAKRNHVEAVTWLLDHGADPNARWAHWDSDVTPLHLAILEDHIEVVRVLLAAGADPSICDTKHDGDALGWARFFARTAIIRLLEEHAAKTPPG